MIVGLVPSTALISEASEITYGQIILEPAEGTEILSAEGQPLEESLITLDGKDGLWYPVGEKLEYTIAVEDGYALEYVTWESATSEDDGILYDSEKEVFYGIVEEGTNTITTWASEDQETSWEEDIFTSFGFASTQVGDANRYFKSGEAPAEEAVFWFVFMSDEIDEYFNEDDWTYDLTYDEYMEIVDSYFATYNEMKTYLTQHNYMDTSTNKVHISAGGFGDAWEWKILSYYESPEGEYKLQGLFLNQPVEDTTGMTEYVDYYTNSFGYAMYIDEAIELTLVEIDGTYKIQAYETMDYYINENDDGCDLYVLGEDKSDETKSAVDKYSRVILYEDTGVRFETTDGEELATALNTFENNGDYWYKSSEGFSWKVTAEDDYVITGVEYRTVDDVITVETSGTVPANTGAVELEAFTSVIFTVDSPHAIVKAESGLAEYGDQQYLYDGWESVVLSVTPEDGYEVVAVYINGVKAEGNATENQYIIDPYFEPGTIKVITKLLNTVVVDSTEAGVSLAVSAEDKEKMAGLELVVKTPESDELEEIETLVYDYVYGDVSMETFDICLTNENGEVVNNDVTKIVTLPVPEGWNADYVSIYYVNPENGEITDMYAYPSEDGTSVTFETNHFSYYVMVEEIEAEDIFAESDVIRFDGNNRYETAIKAADALKKTMGVKKFDSIVLASGDNYPDALAGSYLACVYGAPILLVNKKAANVELVKEYIVNNLEEDGNVFILGGQAAVAESFENLLKAEDINVDRLEGSNRYETNIEILKESGVTDEPILVCCGTDYADSLSASSVGLSILLVKGNLTASQKEYLATLDSNEVYLVGGTKAVPSAVESYFESNGYDVTRFAGANRYETSTLVAEAFFSYSEAAVLAYGRNFPDGLSGGPLAMSLGAPIVLVEKSKTSFAKAYIEEAEVEKVAVMGGTAAMADETVKAVFK